MAQPKLNTSCIPFPSANCDSRSKSAVDIYSGYSWRTRVKRKFGGSTSSSSSSSSSAAPAAKRTRTHSQLLESASQAKKIIEKEYARDPCWNRRPRFFSFANDGRNIDEKTRYERRMKLVRYRTCKRYWAHLLHDASYTGEGQTVN
ncbi:hypothetical protein PNOK_0129200 [Pyrrhoderma noxium]|uniref:Uncharacterized protein n=1 Tax=Pyrrhoderma noxium TaxID=2282107 RepID=A0A286UXF7_9AGAM|nr:hypothetical protein PNOK_0129200 [Pyrrhoderma noxium]